jgi:hypothetical protein
MAHPELVARLRSLLEPEGDALIAVYLYGSQARGEARDDSDVDLALLYLHPPARTLEGSPFLLQDELERELDLRVDAVVLNGAPPDLIQRVLRDGILLVDRDRSARLRFEVRALNEYFDLRPILELYRRGRRPAG